MWYVYIWRDQNACSHGACSTQSLTRFWHNLNDGTVIQFECCRYNEKIHAQTAEYNFAWQIDDLLFWIFVCSSTHTHEDVHARRLTASNKILFLFQFVCEYFFGLILCVPVTWIENGVSFLYTWINYLFEYNKNVRCVCARGAGPYYSCRAVAWVNKRHIST